MLSFHLLAVAAALPFIHSFPLPSLSEHSRLVNNGLNEFGPIRNSFDLVRRVELACNKPGCGKKFKGQRDYDKHMKMPHETHCVDCNKNFDDFYAYNKHMTSARHNPVLQQGLQTCGVDGCTEQHPPSTMGGHRAGHTLRKKKLQNSAPALAGTPKQPDDTAQPWRVHTSQPQVQPSTQNTAPPPPATLPQQPQRADPMRISSIVNP